jgi:hypothetical protein
LFSFSVDFAHVVRCTHVCVMSPRRGSVLCHRDAVLCYVTATRLPWVAPTVAVGLHPRLCYATSTGFMWLFLFSVGSAHVVRGTHGFYEDCKRDNEFSLPFFHFDFILAIL